MGPAPYLGIQPKMWITLVAFAFVGFGVSFTNIPVLPDMIEDASNKLFYIPSSHVSDRISGLLMSSFFAGKCVGGPLSTGLESSLNFGWTTSIVGWIIMIYGMFYTAVSKAIERRKDIMRENVLLGNEMTS